MFRDIESMRSRLAILWTCSVPHRMQQEERESMNLRVPPNTGGRRRIRIPHLEQRNTSA